MVFMKIALSFALVISRFLTTTTTTSTAATAPQTSLHYTANGNFSGNTYLPGKYRFNVADVSGRTTLPTGVKELVYVGDCSGTSSSFKGFVNGFKGDTRLFGFYLVDEPDPSSCSASALRAETTYVHSVLPSAKTFIVLQDLSATSSPTFGTQYDNVVDIFGLDPYPCRSTSGCHYNWIGLSVHKAESQGYPQAKLVPVYQAFGGGSWPDDTGDKYLVPNAIEENTILNTWGSLLPHPVFDYAYSFGVQQGDTAIVNDKTLQSVFTAHNKS